MESWFVHPTRVRLPLSDGQFLDVKQELNALETRRLHTGLMKASSEEGKTWQLDAERVGLPRLLEYILGWSIVEDGTPVPFSEEALNGLQWPRYREIVDAVDAHHARVEAIYEARKNGQGIANPSPVISPLPFAVTGPSPLSAS